MREHTKKFIEEELKELKTVSKKLRERAVTMIYKAQSGHPGGALSAIDLLLVLYKKIINISPEWVLKTKNGKKETGLSSQKDMDLPHYTAFLCEFGYFCPTEVSISGS